MEILICTICSVITSVITTKVLATHYFEIVDGYVDDVCKKTEEFIASVKRKAGE